jgi:serine protease AprX
MKRVLCGVALLLPLSAAPLAAQGTPTKIDEALRQSLRAGCSTERVIIRTKRGYRAGLLQSLKQHGDVVAAEHPSLDAITADVHCDDLETMEGFSSVLSISKDAIVRADAAKKTTTRTAKKTAPVKKAATVPPAKLAAPKKSATTIGRSIFARAAALMAQEAREREGKGAGAQQDKMFETLGVKNARTLLGTVDATSVMLGDVVEDVNFQGADATDNTYEQETLLASATVSSDLTRQYSVTEAPSIGIAVIDSGLNAATDFDKRITHFYDFTGGRAHRTSPSDPYGHGTHVAGLIGSRFVGVAPKVSLVGLRVLDAEGEGRTSDVLRAIEFATDNRAALGIHVINISLGHPVYEPALTDPLVQAVERAVRAGLVVVTSAGNFGTNPRTGEPGYAGVVSPGNAPSALTVASLQTFDTIARGDDRIALYSSRGPTWYDAYAKPDIAAPGHNMLSLAAPGSYLRKLHEQRGGSGNYMRLSGTSMAAGVTSGLVGLMLQANPRLTPNALKALLQFSAIAVHNADGGLFDPLTQGTGAINGNGALQLAAAIDATQPVGAKWLLAGVPMQSVIGGETLDWSQAILWGSHRAVGDGLIDENRGAWATGVVWGDGLEEDNIVWGTNCDGSAECDNIVWGTAFDEEDNIVWGTSFVWAEEDNIVWGTYADFEEDNIVWGTNVVWGTGLVGVVLGTSEGEEDNIVWGTSEGEEDNIVWGTLAPTNVAWGDLYELNIVWGTNEDGEEDNIVWGTSIISGDRMIVGRRPDAGRSRRVARF